MKMKKRIFDYAISVMNEKIKTLQDALNDLKTGRSSDSKSSAGDKHETAQAMMQLEQEKINSQLSEVVAQKQVLEKIDITLKSSQIINGSLVKTNGMNLFISVALNKMVMDDTTVIFLSAQSPLGKKLLGLEKNDCAEINGVKYTVEEIE